MRINKNFPSFIFFVFFIISLNLCNIFSVRSTLEKKYGDERKVILQKYLERRTNSGVDLDAEDIKSVTEKLNELNSGHSTVSSSLKGHGDENTQGLPKTRGTFPRQKSEKFQRNSRIVEEVLKRAANTMGAGKRRIFSAFQSKDEKKSVSTEEQLRALKNKQKLLAEEALKISEQLEAADLFNRRRTVDLAFERMRDADMKKKEAEAMAADAERKRREAEEELLQKKLELEEEQRKSELELQRKLELEQAQRAAELEEIQRRLQVEEARKKAELEAIKKKAELEEAKIKEAELEEARRKAELEEAKRKEAELEEARKRAELEEARKRAELEEARKRAELEEAKKRAELEEARRKEAELEEAKRKEAELEEAKRKEAELEEARRKAELEEAKRKEAELEEARREAELEEARKRASEQVQKKWEIKKSQDSFLLQDFSSFWSKWFAESSLLHNALQFGQDRTALPQQVQNYLDKAKSSMSAGVQLLDSGMSNLKECNFLETRDILFLEAFNYLMQNLFNIKLTPETYCYLFTNSKKRDTNNFCQSLIRYLERDSKVVPSEQIYSIEKRALGYVAASQFSKKDLTSLGVKKINKENRSLSNECASDKVIFAGAVNLVSDLYRFDLRILNIIGVLDVCSILKGYTSTKDRLWNLGYLLYPQFGNSEELALCLLLSKESLETFYKGISTYFSDYLLDNEMDVIQQVNPMQQIQKVEDVIRADSDSSGVIRTADRHVGDYFPIPKVPGPPSRLGASGKGPYLSPVDIFSPPVPSEPLDYLKSIDTALPSNLPEKASGRGYITNMQVHMQPRTYEDQFAYGSESFIAPKLSYFKRVSEREYKHQLKLKQLKEEQKRQEKRRRERISRGYRDLNISRDTSIGSDESASELPDSSEEPSPLPSDDELPPKTTPSKLAVELHTFVPKTDTKVYNRNRLYGAQLTYNTLKPSRYRHSDDSEESEHSELSTSESESSESTIGLPKKSSSIKIDTKSSNIEPETRSDEQENLNKPTLIPLTTETAAKEIPLKCPNLTRAQQKRALNLFRVMKYLYKGSTSGWYVTAFCRAVFFAEKDICISKGTKSLELKKIAAECSEGLMNASFIVKNPLLAQIGKQVCFSLYKRRLSTLCIQ